MKIKDLPIIKIIKLFILVIIINKIIWEIPVYINDVKSGLIGVDLHDNIFYEIGYFVVWILIGFFNFVKKTVIDDPLGILWYCLIFLFCRYVVIYNSERIYQKERVDISDKETETYYRDIIKNYSPAVLSYINDFKLGKNDVVATLMSLELKGKIKIDKYLHFLDNDTSDLSLNEKYVLERIDDASEVVDISMSHFKSTVIEDCLNSNLICDIKFVVKIVLMILFYLASLSLCNILINFIDNGSGKTVEFIINIIKIYTFFSPLFFVIFVYFYFSLIFYSPYKRTNDGIIINKKVNGLKKFIKDFSSLDEKEYKQINLWKEYLIYSVIIDNNDKVVNQMKKFINYLV